MNTKSTFIVLLFTLTSFFLNAQFTIGIEGGAIRSWPDYGPVELPENAATEVDRVFFNAQIYYSINDFFSLGIEPGYVERGAACEPGFIIFDSDTRLLVDYLETPLMLRGSIDFDNRNFEIYGKLGYSFGLLVKAKREIIDLSGDSDPQIDIINVRDQTRISRIDYGINAGLGFAIDFGSNQIFLESTYYRGQNDIVPATISRTRAVQIGLGYAVKI